MMSGTVIDQAGSVIDGATIKVMVAGSSVRFADGSDSAATVAKAGGFSFTNLPTGVGLIVEAGATNFSSQTKTVEPLSNAAAVLSFQMTPAPIPSPTSTPTPSPTPYVAYQSSGTSSDLLQVRFVTASTGFVVGRAGTFLITNDKGQTWIRRGQSTFAGLDLFSLHFLNANTGWVLGVSSDGGWNPVRLFRTTDGGLNWQELTIPAHEVMGYYVDSSHFSRVLFTDVNTGYLATDVGSSGAAGQYKLALTTDGGVTWTEQPGMADRRDLAAFGGQVFATGRGGQNRFEPGVGWASLAAQGTDAETQFTSASVAWRRGYDTLTRSADGGGSYAPILNSFRDAIVDMYFVNDTQGFLETRTDGKATLHEVYHNGSLMGFKRALPLDYVSNDFFMVDVTSGWFVGPDGKISRYVFPSL